MNGVTGVTTNVPSLTAVRTLGANASDTALATVRLATAQRINRGADDPAGLIASENLRAALASMDAEMRSIDRADAVANTADGALGQISELLSDAQSRAVANANSAGISDAERAANQLEVDSAIATADRIASTTRFNGQPLFTGDVAVGIEGATIDLGRADSASIGAVSVGGAGYRLADVTSGAALNIVDGNIDGAAGSIGAAISDVATRRGAIGAFQSDTLASQRRATQVAFENTAAANSVIRDTDFAAESARLARGQALSSASLAAASLANSAPASSLRLVR